MSPQAKYRPTVNDATTAHHEHEHTPGQGVPVVVLVDEGYFGQEALTDELGPGFDVHFESGPVCAHGVMSVLSWPIVLAPRALHPMPGDVMLAEFARHRYDFVGLLLLDDEPLDRLPDGVHAIVRRPLRPGTLRLHIEAALAMRTRLLAERAGCTRMGHDFAQLRDGLRHELRGQLQSVVGLASLVLEIERPKRPAGDELIDFVERISAAGDRLTHLVDALGDWLNASRRGFEPAVVDLGELVAEVVAKVRSARTTNVGAVTVEGLEPGVVARVSGDARMLHKALETLIERALAQTKLARVRITRDVAGWSLVVSDVCPRMLPVAQRDKAFELFERVAGGDGIGFALVRTIAERHGATVKLAPLAEGGHEAVLTLPWDHASQPAGAGGDVA